MINIEKNGQIIRTSRNLRGLRDYARVSPVARVELTPQGVCNGRLRVLYRDGASTSANFASFHIMVDFVRNRRSWRGAEIVNYGEDVGYLTKPGIIAGQ
ncbi:hypothetical protein UFOVP147_21 [uncultured Caudovirales phage]|uniref:Uncharacterized protein n=1 Tax=uncultured Caudovirales phage TaxID=2100421 RepID=A0A6J7W189_9CAUD|nr:hypothetical protein UFOVP147_21 [uncultured Caudovirales phage]